MTHDNIQDIAITAYDYPLPDERIAKFPLQQRDQSKLLIWKNHAISEGIFEQLPDQLSSDSLLVYNNTKVIQARLHFHKSSGAKIEIFCLEPLVPSDYLLVFQSTHSCTWSCMVGNLKKWKEGTLTQELSIGTQSITLTATRLEATAGMAHTIRFDWNNAEITFADILEQIGELPIPPYLNRKTENSDLETYQTVYSKIKGSVAAPTAGLHFTPEVLNKIGKRGIERAEVTLHVGAGTFQPVKSDIIGGHTMHTEMISVELGTIKQLRAKLGHIVAVGTTSVRTLESLYYLGMNLLCNPDKPSLLVTQWQPYQTGEKPTAEASLDALIAYMEQEQLDHISAATQIMIVPSFQFRIVSTIITNFHQPKSTLLLLISAFVGESHWRTIYDYALSHDFRFLSYGDSSILFNH